jgi:hypothetical protein
MLGAMNTKANVGFRGELVGTKVIRGAEFRHTKDWRWRLAQRIRDFVLRMRVIR